MKNGIIYKEDEFVRKHDIIDALCHCDRDGDSVAGWLFDDSAGQPRVGARDKTRDALIDLGIDLTIDQHPNYTGRDE